MSVTSYIGIDIGTSSVKTVAFDAEMAAIASRKTACRARVFGDGWAEIDPEAWVVAVKAHLEGLNSELCQKGYEVAAIGLTAQMHTTVFVDEAGNSVRPAIMWHDLRTRDIAATARKRLIESGCGDNAAIVSTGSPLANLLWLREHEPDSYKACRHVLIAKDYVRLRLTGSIGTDWCDASTSSMFDRKTGTWDTSVLDLFDLDASMFPKVLPSADASATVQLSDRDVPLTVGTGDNAASAVANGAFAPDALPLVSLGSSVVLIAPGSQGTWREHGKNVLFKLDNGSPVQMITQATVQAGTRARLWWQNVDEGARDEASEQKVAASLGKNEVVFLPYLDGDKNIYADPDMRGAFIGLGLETHGAEMQRSVFEGVAYGLRRLSELVETDQERRRSLILIGGGAQSVVWPDLIAAVLNRSVLVATKMGEAVLGAAMLAYAAREGSLPILDQAFVRHDPRPELVSAYDAGYR